MSRNSAIIIRYAMSALFLWFGAQQLLHPEAWVSFLPEWLGYVPVPPEMFVRWNGMFEVVGAVMLAVGCFTRIVAALLGAHLLAIAVTVGGAIGVRDAALAATTIALAFSRPDECTFDHRSAKTAPPKASA